MLTAAHCFAGRTAEPGNNGVYMGSNDLNGDGQKIGVRKIITHSQYDSFGYENDIALLALKTPANFTPISRVGAEQEGLNTPGVTAVVTGWGHTQEDGMISLMLMEVAVDIVSNDQCNATESYDGRVTPRMICAGFAEGGKDACQGDSGGPKVVSDGSGGYLLSGVVSWGHGCAQPKKYGVYTRVSAFENWIADHMN